MCWHCPEPKVEGQLASRIVTVVSRASADHLPCPSVPFHKVRFHDITKMSVIVEASEFHSCVDREIVFSIRLNMIEYTVDNLSYVYVSTVYEFAIQSRTGRET